MLHLQQSHPERALRGIQPPGHHAHRRLQLHHLGILHVCLSVPGALHPRDVEARHGQAAARQEEPPLRLLHRGPQRGERHRQPREVHQGAGLSLRAHRRLRRGRRLHGPHGQGGQARRRIVYERNDLRARARAGCSTTASTASSTSIPASTRHSLSSMPTTCSRLATSPR